MALIANLWWLWLTSTVCAGTYALRIQYLRAKALSEHVGHTVTSVLKGDPEMIGDSAQRITNDLTQGFFFSMGRFIAAVVIGSVSAILLLISIAVNLISYIVSVNR